MNILALLYVLVRHRTWMVAGWKLGGARHRQDVLWAHRTPKGTLRAEVYWDGRDWRVKRLEVA